MEPLAALARRFIESGATVFAAVPSLDDGLLIFPPGVRLLQAPLWPNRPRLDGRSREMGGRSLANLLMSMGLDEPSGAPRLAAWKTLVEAIEPEVIVADYAPGLSLAARGKAPMAAFGIGYCIPPSREPEFPDMPGTENLERLDEKPLVDAVNRTMESAGLLPISRLPEAFAADREVVMCFDAMDPYCAFRQDSHLPPFLSPPPAEIFDAGPRPASTDKPSIFVYLNEPHERGKLILAALTRIDARIRVVMNWIDADIERIVSRHGIVIERQRLHPREIIASDLVISFGSHRLLATCLAAGAPQLVFPMDLEKSFNLHALTTIGAARAVSPAVTMLNDIVTHIQDAIADTAMARHLNEIAPVYRDRLLAENPIEEAAKRIMSLAR